jgi:hypothetical protein
MDRASGLLLEDQVVQRSAPTPRLRLLVDWEPRHRVFLDNLTDLILRRQPPPIRITSKPARFWNDVFVQPRVPWTSFAESVLWHILIVILFIWSQSRVWTPVSTFKERDSFHHSVVYYPSYPAAGGRVADVPPKSRASAKPHSTAPKSRPEPMRVASEHKPALVTPPDIKQAAARPPDLPASNIVPPIAPLSATSGSNRAALAGPAGVVAPAPEVDPSPGHKLALPQASAVAPAPELGGPSAGRAVASPGIPGARVVPPPPSLQSSHSGHSPSLAGTGSQVVPPPASLLSATDAARAGRAGAQPGLGSAVVPPAPNVQVSGTARGDAHVNSMAAGGQQVIQPPPSLQASGDPSRPGRMSSIAGAPNGAVPPAPSLAGSGEQGGKRMGTITGSGSQVVPPPPAVQGPGSSFSAGRSPGAQQAVPPAPSAPGAGGPGGGTRIGSLSGSGSEVVPPIPSLDNGGNAGASGRLGGFSPGGSQVTRPPAQYADEDDPNEPLPFAPQSPPQTATDDSASTIEELPVGFLGLIWAPPGTSYFSNFEVFVAKRKIGKDQMQLIKLVYEFLPYQRRLSEYDLNNLPPRVIKLKVTPDPSCNESLGQMIQPYMDPNKDSAEAPKVPRALSSSDLSAVLPCFRTTADDFRKAMTRGR